MNGAFMLNAGTVADDGDKDDLTGWADLDLFFANTDGDGDAKKKDNVDRKAGEIVTDLVIR